MGHENTGRKNKITRMKNRKSGATPGAWVVSSNDRGRKKIYKNKTTGERKIYLQDKEEFEIELYNPTQNNVLAVIHLDGKPISKSGLIVKNGQRIYLDCFIDDKKKFVFETYDVENTNEVHEAISTNGNLEVYFYEEEIAEKYDLPKIIESHHHYHDIYWYPQRRWWDPYWYYNSGTITVNNDNITNTPNITFGGSTTSDFTYTNNSNTNVSLTGSVDVGDALKSYYSDNNLQEINASIETGKVGKGEKSEQKFNEIQMDFSNSTLNEVRFKLMPESRKPATKSELKTSKEVHKAFLKKSQDKIEKVHNIYSALNELKELLENGLIDEEEFKDLKREVMGK